MAAAVTPRVLAIDWSGAVSGAAEKTWLAEVVDGRLVRLENGRSREELARHLPAAARTDPRMVVGLDFAFSLPAWFLEAKGLDAAPALWALAESEVEGWLAACAWPFWGRPGVGKPVNIPEHFRRADREVPAVQGIRPKSVFQIGGAGAVGTGSLRGMRLLHQLRRAGFSIWPFDPPGWPRVVEIYPRALTGAVVKTDAAAREGYLARHYPGLDAGLRSRAAGSDDAFAAAVSALVMARHAAGLAALQPAADPTVRREGRIWLPPGSAAPVPVAAPPAGPAAPAPAPSPAAPARRPPAIPIAPVAPPPSGFVVGQRYHHLLGDYEVLAVVPPRLRVRYDDGRLATLHIPSLLRAQEQQDREGRGAS